MALLAAHAELAVVGVVLAVAVEAALAGLGHGFAAWGSLGVTRFTGHADVFTCEGVGRLSGVVEIPGFPAACVVAGLATGAQFGLVAVVFAMAGHAVALYVIETFCCMTAFAFDPVVAAG